MARCSSRLVSSSTSAVGDPRRAGLLVDDRAPDPLQEPLRADDRPGLPRPGHVQRAHRHLVHAERVGAVLARTSRPGVTTFFSDLPILPYSRLTGSSP